MHLEYSKLIVGGFVLFLIPTRSFTKMAIENGQWWVTALAEIPKVIQDGNWIVANPKKYEISIDSYNTGSVVYSKSK